MSCDGQYPTTQRSAILWLHYIYIHVCSTYVCMMYIYTYKSLLQPGRSATLNRHPFLSIHRSFGKLDLVSHYLVVVLSKCNFSHD